MCHRLMRYGLLACCALFAASAPGASTAQLAEVPTVRPRVGLVLAGGGAKGAAHIGVIRVLEELHVPVDCVVGTSMGALVGAVYASGVAPKDIERAVLEIDWARTVGGQGRRDRMPIARKLQNLSYSNSLEFGFGRRGVRMPAGFIATQEIEQVIRSLVASARFTRDFDDLPIPFRAVATDMTSGDMVVLDSGDIADAMRASMAIPGVFSPIVVDGRVLSDGGMTRNLPVDIARALCADVVIAVWMSTPPPEAIGLESAFSLMQRSMEVMISANERLQIAALADSDVRIEVPMGDIGSTDFARVPEALELGRRAATAASDSLRRYAVSDSDYNAWTAELAAQENEIGPLAEVRIEGLQRVNEDYVRGQLVDARPGNAPTVDEVVADVERIYALGDFERVEYAATGPANAPVFEITPVEKSWGPDIFKFDVGLSTYEGGDIFAILRLDHDRTWINARGGRWHNALQAGRQSLLVSDFYQPFDEKQRYFAHAIGRGGEDYEDLYLDGERIARFKVREVATQLDFGVNFGTRAQLRLGVERGEFSAGVDTGLPVLPSLSKTPDTNIQLRGVYDTRDAVALPTRGAFMNLRYVRSEDWLGGEQNYELVEGVLTQSLQVRGGDSLTLIAGAAERLQGDLPVTQELKLGGIRTFPGLRPGELRGTGYWFAGTSYSWRVVDLQPLFGQALYAGVRFQVADIDERYDAPPADDDTIYGLAGSLSGRTPIGSLLFSLGYVEGGSWELQFMIGRPIDEGSMLDDVF